MAAAPIGRNRLKQPTFYREDSFKGDINLTKTTTLMLKYTNDSWSFGPSAVGNTGWGADAGASQIQESWSQPGRIAVARLSKVFGASAVNDFQFLLLGESHQISPKRRQPRQQALNKVIPTFFRLRGIRPTILRCGSMAASSDHWSFAPWSNREDLFCLAR